LSRLVCWSGSDYDGLPYVIGYYVVEIFL